MLLHPSPTLPAKGENQNHEEHFRDFHFQRDGAEVPFPIPPAKCNEKPWTSVMKQTEEAERKKGESRLARDLRTWGILRGISGGVSSLGFLCALNILRCGAEEARRASAEACSPWLKDQARGTWRDRKHLGNNCGTPAKHCRNPCGPIPTRASKGSVGSLDQNIHRLKSAPTTGAQRRPRREPGARWE